MAAGAVSVGLSINGNNPLTDFFVPANAEVTLLFEGVGTTTDTQIRVESLTAEIVPEPSSSLLVALGGLVLFGRRRR